MKNDTLDGVEKRPKTSKILAVKVIDFVPGFIVKYAKFYWIVQISYFFFFLFVLSKILYVFRNFQKLNGLFYTA